MTLAQLMQGCACVVVVSSSSSSSSTSRSSISMSSKSGLSTKMTTTTRTTQTIHISSTRSTTRSVSSSSSTQTIKKTTTSTSVPTPTFQSCPIAAPSASANAAFDVFWIFNSLTAQMTNSYGHYYGAPTTIDASQFSPMGPPSLSIPAAGSRGEVYAISSRSSLMEAWPQSNGGSWTAPVAISSGSYFGGSRVATSPRFGVNNRTDVFAVTTDLALTMSSLMGGSDSWSAPVSMSKSFAAGIGMSASQRFGQCRTDVYAVDSTGTLMLMSAQGNASFEGPVALSPASTFDPNCCRVTAGRHYGDAGRTNVFAVDSAGAMTVTWYNGTGWTGPRRLSATGAFELCTDIHVTGMASTYAQGPDQTHVFAVNAAHHLSVTSINGTGDWVGPTQVNDLVYGYVDTFPVHPVLATEATPSAFLLSMQGKLHAYSLLSNGTWKGPVVVAAA
ncbi:hypothetical protein ANO11243_094420 [Dothideomycetidae sp. 11243]|nr:hypothetical protein ANO11243_094420 [fungal sp. No.11243]